MAYQCSLCDKHFTRKIYYERHEASCLIKKRNQVDEYSLSPKQMYILINELINKVNYLENEMLEMKSWVKKKQRKCNIIDWLNENCKPEQDFNDWKENIIITNKHLEMIYKYDFVDGMYFILQDLFPIENEDSFPIKGFEQKKNLLFIYTKDSWKSMTNEDFESFINKIHHNIIVLFKKWKDKHQDLIYENEDENDKYLLNVIKVMGGKLPMEQRILRINNKFYNYIKLNLKNIVEYDFTF